MPLMLWHTPGKTVDGRLSSEWLGSALEEASLLRWARRGLRGMRWMRSPLWSRFTFARQKLRSNQPP